MITEKRLDSRLKSHGIIKLLENNSFRYSHSGWEECVCFFLSPKYDCLIVYDVDRDYLRIEKHHSNYNYDVYNALSGNDLNEESLKQALSKAPKI
jgi:hypothetical protein